MASKTEESTLRSRLIVEDRALKRCLRQLSTMCTRHARLTPDEAQQASKRVLQEVRWFRHTVQVAAQSQRRDCAESTRYTEQQATLERMISETCSEIERLSDSLEESRNHKRHKIAYDEIAAEANKRPSRARLAAEIDELNSEIEQLEQEAVTHENVTRSLHGQYSTVLEELTKLADMSKSALSVQDLGIYLGDADMHAEKAGSELNLHASADLSPSALQHHDPRDGFETPLDSGILDDSDAAHESGEHSEDEEGEHSEGEEGEHSEGEEGEHREGEEDEEGEHRGGEEGEEGEDVLGTDVDQGIIGSEEEGECEDEEGELLG